MKLFVKNPEDEKELLEVGSINISLISKIHKKWIEMRTQKIRDAHKKRKARSTQ